MTATTLQHAVLLVVGYGTAFSIAFLLYRLGTRFFREGEKQREAFYLRLSKFAECDDPELLLSDMGHHIEVQRSSGMVEYDSAGYILKYDNSKAVSTQAVLVWKHTVLCLPSISLRIIVGMTIALTMCLVDLFLFSMEAENIQINVNDMDNATIFFNTFIGIMLGFYMSTTLARWWEVRMATVGRMWGAVDDLCLSMSAHLPGYSLRPLRKLVLRYALASFELMFMQAQGEGGSVDQLVGRSLLTQEEALVLRPQPSRPQIIWTWVSGLFYVLHRQGHIDSNMLPFFYARVIDARGGIGATFAYLDSQLPFIYVHLLSVLVHAANAIVAIDAGISAAHWVMDPTDIAQETPKPWVRLFQLIMQTFFYNAFLEIGRIFSDPLGTDFEDFPRHAWHCFMRNECEAFDFTGQAFTVGMKKATAASGKTAPPLYAMGAAPEPAAVSHGSHTPPTPPPSMVAAIASAAMSMPAVTMAGDLITSTSEPLLANML